MRTLFVSYYLSSHGRERGEERETETETRNDVSSVISLIHNEEPTLKTSSNYNYLPEFPHGGFGPQHMSGERTSVQSITLTNRMRSINASSCMPKYLHAIPGFLTRCREIPRTLATVFTLCLNHQVF